MGRTLAMFVCVHSGLERTRHTQHHRAPLGTGQFGLLLGMVPAGYCRAFHHDGLACPSVSFRNRFTMYSQALAFT